MRLSHVWSRAVPVFDDERLVSLAGLVPVMGLAERAGLSELIDERVRFKSWLVNAVNTTSATCASEISCPVSGSITAPG